MNIILKCLGGILLLSFAVLIIVVVIIKNLSLSNYNPFGREEMDLEFFGQTMSILSENNIIAIPIFGTLLGIIRHNNLIPWDDDIDVGINIDDVGKLLSLNEKLHNNGLYLVKVKYPFQPVYYKICRTCNKKIKFKNWSWPFIDIFTYTIGKDEILINEHDKLKFPKEDLLPINKSFKIDDKVLISLPNNPVKMLNKMYGKNWKNICVSSSMNHRLEKPYNKIYTVPCNNIQDKINYDSLFSNTWVINLDKDTKRLQTTQERLKQLDIIPKRWNATKSSSSECKNLYKKFLDSDKLKTFFSKLNIPALTLNQNEIACYLSHIKLWEKLYKKGIKNAIIFEDDIIFSSELRKKDIIDIVENSKGFDIIFLGHCDDMFVNKIHKPGTSLCSHAYIVSHSGLEKLINFNTKLDKIDYIIRSFCKSNLCFKTKHVENSEKTFGYGLIHQDRKTFNSNLR